MNSHAPAARFALAPRQATMLWLAGLVVVALALRLLAWHWHEFYPLGGDEQEYLDQALILLRERRYVELPLMRPPMYTLFLAVAIRLVDSLVQNLRLVQAVLGALTALPVYAFARDLCGRRVALLAAAVFACDYTLALAATELLTETVFLCGLITCLWLLLRAGRTPDITRDVVLAGLALGALTLTRSVALPLLPLGAAWLLVRRAGDTGRSFRLAWAPALAFVLATLLVLLPWTARNVMTYQALIVVDTTGAENLWLDNDAAGRETVKRELYALGDDRGLRQQLATRRGIQAIVSDPARFAAKAWGEAQRLFALQHFDDMRSRPEIWVPPAEVGLRLALGDGVWLLILFGGIAGTWLFRPAAPAVGASSFDPRWVLVPWSLYIVMTSLLFHVELRYRLPLIPALLPYCAWLLASVRRLLRPVSAGRAAGALLSCAGVFALMLLHRPYLHESAMLVQKHVALWNAQQALQQGDAPRAREQAKRAIEADPETALGYVVTALAWLDSGESSAALDAARAAERAMPAHPLPHLVLGALARQAGDMTTARAEFAYEANSLQDLQQWSWEAFASFAVPPLQLAIGDGRDLGFVRGFALPEQSMRWTSAHSELRLSVRPAVRVLRLELASGRPDSQPQGRVAVRWNGRLLGNLDLAPHWAWYELNLPAQAGDQAATAIVTLQADTFRPRDLDRASADGRTLGVMMRAAEVVP